MTSAELDALQALADAAPLRRPGMFGSDAEWQHHDAFVAAARTAVPDLIAALRAELGESARLRGALEWYADPENYLALYTMNGVVDTECPAVYDEGRRAREALAERSKP